MRPPATKPKSDKPTLADFEQLRNQFQGAADRLGASHELDQAKNLVAQAVNWVNMYFAGRRA